MKIIKKWNFWIFLLGMMMGIVLIILGLTMGHDIANIRLEGSEL